MTLSPGQTLKDRYRIVTLLGQGGFGAVYRAWDLNLERPRALKENLDTSESAQRQFKREAQLLSDLSHPNLPKVIDHFVLPGQGQYLVMEYVEGEDLQQMLERQGPLAEAQAVDWIGQVCDALIYLHSQNPPVIHRDIKPANIKITPQGKAMLVDFGIAKASAPGQKTTVGARAVTPGYSPPEQYGQGVTDAQSDVYALGATLYALLTGRAPVDSVDLLARNVPPPPPVRQLNPAVSAQVEAAIAGAMQLERANRTAGTAAFKASLLYKGQPRTQMVLAPSGSVVALVGTGVPDTQRVPAPAQARLKPVKGKSPLGWIVGLLAVVAIGWFGLGGIGSKEQPPTETAVAVQPLETTAAPAITQAPPTVKMPTVTRAQSSPSTDTPAPAPTEQPVLTPTDAPYALEQTYTDLKGVQMVLIPAGEFQMGSDKGDSEENPMHTVYLDAFYMDINEATNALYEKCVQAGTCSPPSDSSSYIRSSYYGNPEFANYPVVFVEWEQARTFCEQWRGARLPTEAEWEKAARGGLEGKYYPWGNDDPICQKGVMNGAKFVDPPGCNETDTEPVGSYSPNGYGLYDMVGNVWEWVWDWFGPYSNSYAINPQGPVSGESRILRGGSWRDSPYWLGVVIRKYYFTERFGDFGFRCAADALPRP